MWDNLRAKSCPLVYLWVVVPLEPSKPGRKQLGGTGHFTAHWRHLVLPWFTLGVYLPQNHTALGWARLTRNWDRGVADTVRDEKASSPEQEHTGTWWYFYDKRSKGSIFPTFSHGISATSFPKGSYMQEPGGISMLRHKVLGKAVQICATDQK